MMKLIPVLALMIALGGAAGIAEAGKVYKWVDKDGNVHYSNTPPPEASQEEREVLDESGRVTETLRAPLTPEEIEADRERQAQAAEEARRKEEQASKDKMLLQTYISPEEIAMARDGRIAALEAQVKVASGTIASLETQLAQLEQQATGLREAGKPVPEPLQARLDKTRAELVENQKFLVARQDEQDRIREKYNADIERFKELKGIK